ncbi:S1C family serine protease [Phenylobacterium sp. LjRoot225]|uniref:S1C family serine protease n=1 Tax=Phenylobacterium sp. LjRoot225 TaxID=3342285 RepID=UPI003ECDD519
MKWVHVVAGVLAACCATSYPLAAQLGQPVRRASGKPAAGPAPDFARPIKGAGAAFGKVLQRLESPPVAANRGAAETQVYQHAAAAVVLVVTEKGMGSGALISADGQIVTNLHVVQGAKQVAVVFKPPMEGAAPGKADLRRATLLKVDEVADLALLKVDQIPAGVQPITLGDTGKLQVGADVHAIGHPTGETWTYTRGVVSQIRRAYNWKAGDKVQHEATVIQTQTPINPGNSGGPLLDSQANLVGINSFGDAEAEGLNFAVSVDDVKNFLARGQDRTVAPQVAAECEWKDLEESDWKDPKGKAYLIDSDCDNAGDTVLILPDSRREPSILMRDENGRGVYDTIYYDKNRDGHPEWAVYDTDGDGKADLRGDFRNNEDDPYRWEKISH